MRGLRSHLSYANVVATVCLFIVLGGTSYAVATGSIDSRAIKNNTVRSKDIRNNDLRSTDVRNSSLLARDFKPGQLPAGARGPQGPQGSRGPRGPEGPPGFADTVREIDFTPLSATDEKFARAICPDDLVVLGGGFEVLGAVSDYHKITVYQSDDWGDGGSWVVRARENQPVDDDWQLLASAICG